MALILGSPLFPPRAMQYEVFECFLFLPTSLTCFPASLTRVPLEFRLFFSLSTTTLTPDFYCNLLHSLLLLIFYIFVIIVFLLRFFPPIFLNYFCYSSFDFFRSLFFCFISFPPLTFLTSILFSTILFPAFILLRYCSLLFAILDFMLLIHISPLIAACAAHFGAFKILLIAVFTFFCRLSISSPLMSITPVPYRALGNSTPFQFVFSINRHHTLWQLFSVTELVIMINLFILFIISCFCPSNMLLFACTFTTRYFNSSNTSILCIFSFFSFVLTFCSFSSISWRLCFPSISLIISIRLSAFSFTDINLSSA